ncbi:MAG TPA: plastocyanin/azurin family copper-binding protein [Gemmatimonadales bacterium]|nr:plastocyanin/azurin family copper-binding protein [Gemmatimonadales bacterium]
MRRTAVLRMLAIASLAACGGGGGSDTTTGPAMGGTSAGVTVGNNFFSPATMNLAPGGTVTWTWAPGDTLHQIAFVDNAPGSAKQSMGTFQRTFSTAGTYNYYCTVHGPALMSGPITVGSGGSTGGTAGGGGGGGGGGGTGYPGGP